MSNVVFGPNGFLQCKVGGVYKMIGCQITARISFANELIGKTDRNAGLFRKKRVRMSDMSASVSGLTTLETDDQTISALYFLQEGVRRTEQDIRMKFTDEAGVSREIQGAFLVEAIEFSTDTTAFSNFDLSLSGSGGITITAGASDVPINAGDILSDWFATTPGGNSVSGDGEYKGYNFEGMRIIEVDREGVQYDEADVAVGRFYSYDGTSISFDPINPFNDGERVFVIWEVI